MRRWSALISTLTKPSKTLFTHLADRRERSGALHLDRDLLARRSQARAVDLWVRKSGLRSKRKVSDSSEMRRRVSRCVAFAPRFIK